MNKFVRAISLLLIAVIVMSLSACVGNPETPIIKNKDIDKMLEDAKNSDGVGMNELIGKYDSYKKSINNDSFNVSVDINASVGIPKVDKMSVIRVKQKPFTQEFLDKVKKELVGDTKLYDGSALRGLTKREIELDIRMYEEEIAELERQHPDEDQTNLKQELKRLRERYNNAPEKPNVKAKPCDGRLHSVGEAYKKNKNDDYYSWLYGLNPDGEFFYGVSDGENGEYLSLSVNNSKNDSNLLSFRKSYHGYEETSGMAPNNEVSLIHWEGSEIPEEYKGGYLKLSGDEVSLSGDEALKKTNGFMKKVGLGDDFNMTACKIFTENVDMRHADKISDKMPCRSYYVIRYSRKINGATVTENGDSKYSENWSGESYSKQTWHQESIVFRVNDNGIVGFDYVSPIETMETVVDSATVKSFEEIKKNFEKMVVISNASKDKHVEIKVNSVEFGYTRISEKDNFSTGLLVPVWAFYGTNTNSRSFNKEAPGPIEINIMTINAIDGTVIDKVLGY